METFFSDSSHLRYWLCNASVSHVACSVSWPPIIAAIGYAPCVRAWDPTSRDEPEFKPVHQLLEVDGERFVAVTVKGDLLVAADASSSGRISVWDTSTWTRQQTLTAGAPVTSLDASRTYIAAGTAAGYVRVWKRQSSSDATFTQFFSPDLQLDSLPVYCVKLGPLRQPAGGAGAGGGGAGSGGGGGSGGDGSGIDAVMVVHTRGNGRVSAWRLSDAKIIGTLGRSGPLDSPEALLSANVLHACLAKDVLLTCSWLPGKDPLLQWIHPVQRAGGEVPGISQHLSGLSQPLCCDYDGSVIVMGCEDGMVWVWGLLQGQVQGPAQQQQPPAEDVVSHWRGYHRGAVGAVACLPHRGQIASAGADSCVKLWSMAGSLLAVARLGWQPTALAVNELALVVGGAAGQLQIILLLTEEQAAASRPTEAERVEAQTPPTCPDSATSRESMAQYGYWFDARSPKAAAVSSSRSGAGSAGLWGRASEHPDAFVAFVPPRRQVTLADLQQHQHRGSGSPGGQAAVSSGTVNGQGVGGGDGASAGATDLGAGRSSGGGGGGGGGGAKASSFNMQAALKGAQQSATGQAAAQAAADEAKRAQLQAMGEGPGVARSRGAVQLESATSATMGRKCANPSCMQREGLLALQQQQQQSGGAAGVFKRCGACKSAFYCSTHCQSTHWRDGHKKECPLLAEAWREQQQGQQEQQRQRQQPESTAASLARSTDVSGSEHRGTDVAAGRSSACEDESSRTRELLAVGDVVGDAGRNSGLSDAERSWGRSRPAEAVGLAEVPPSDIARVGSRGGSLTASLAGLEVAPATGDGGSNGQTAVASTLDCLNELD